MTIKNEKLAQNRVNESVKMLGVFITPTLSWKSHFEQMRTKIHQSVTKLMATNITTN